MRAIARTSKYVSRRLRTASEAAAALPLVNGMPACWPFLSHFERACGCGVPSVWWHRKAPCGGVARFRLEGKGGGVGDGHVASAASVVTWGDACVARATQRPFPVDVGVTSARCGGGATPKLAFFMRREPQEHPFWGGSAILATFADLPVGFYGKRSSRRRRRSAVSRQPYP